MGKVILSISMSLDGYVAAPQAGPGRGLGVGGEVLHDWVHGGEWNSFDAEGTDRQVMEALFARIGATIVGRRMFDHAEEWHGNPPGGLPCIVLTHHAPERWAAPGSPFTFISGDVSKAATAAHERAGDKDIYLAGGADVAQQFLRAGLVDEIEIHLVPVLLGAGVQLFDRIGADPIRMTPREVVRSPYATHLRFDINT